MAIRLKIRKLPWIITKTNSEVKFNLQNCQLMTFSSATKSSSCQVSFSATRNTTTKATDNLTFSFWEILNVIFYKQYGFFSVLAAIIRENFDKQLWIEKSEGFAIQLSTWPLRASDVSTADWRKSKTIVIFLTCVVTAFLRAGILV